MTEHPENHAIARLEPLIGEWRMEAVFPSTSPIDTSEAQGTARTVFEWLPERQFVVQRWEVPHPAAPDGIAIIGFDRNRGNYLQHSDQGASRLPSSTTRYNIGRAADIQEGERRVFEIASRSAGSSPAFEAVLAAGALRASVARIGRELEPALA